MKIAAVVSPTLPCSILACNWTPLDSIQLGVMMQSPAQSITG